MPPKGETKKAVGAAAKIRKWSPAHQARLESLAQMDQVVRDVSTTLAKLSVRMERKSSDTDGFEVLASTVGKDGLRATVYDGKTGEKRLEDDEESRKSIVLARGLVRGIFKPDHPYRTKLGAVSTLVTSAAGVLNTQASVSSVSSAGEWSAIDQLFDEVFIHTLTLHYQPRNDAAGTGSVAAGTTGGSFMVTGAPASSVGNAGLVMVALFNGASGYSTCAAMLSNPTKHFAHSGHPFSYAWKNNTKFDPRGVVAQNTAWQGWTLISNVTNYGGSLQVRTFGDVVLGDTAHALTCGDICFVWDVSFRARA